MFHDLGAVLKVKHQPLICVYRHMINHGVPELLVKCDGKLFLLSERKEETTDADRFHFPFFQVFLQLCVSLPQFLISFNISVVANLEVGLIHCLRGVFFHTTTNQTGGDLHLPQNNIQLRVHSGCIC